MSDARMTEQSPIRYQQPADSLMKRSGYLRPRNKAVIAREATSTDCLQPQSHGLHERCSQTEENREVPLQNR